MRDADEICKCKGCHTGRTAFPDSRILSGRIYVKHLEGRESGQLGNIYHLSKASIRRIIAKEKAGYQKMKEIIEQMLPLWGIESGQLLQIYPSAWEINHSYVLKVYDDREQMERNIKTAEILLDCGIPAAETVLTETGEKYAVYAAQQSFYFLLSKKLQGSHISDIKDKSVAREAGRAIAKLHRAFIKCEREMEFWDNSLLQEMKGWIREQLADHVWRTVSEEEYAKTVESLESVYDSLPKQLIHRDVHLGNFLFLEGKLLGYIDFDLSQRNIRIFDVCYFLAGLLAEETDDAFTKAEWIESVQAVMAGYESIGSLSANEKKAMPCVMECIEILFAAYFSRMNDTKRACDAGKVFRFIRSCERDIENAI